MIKMKDLRKIFGNLDKTIAGDMVTKKQKDYLKKHKGIQRFGDFDKDGVINGLDCAPYNPKEHAMKARLRFKRDNLLKGKVPNRPGLYRFYDKDGKLIYVGHARRLRHRVQSYYQKDDFKAHPTKRPLRNKIHTYEYEVTPRKKAQEREKRLKKKAIFNVW